MKEEWDKLLIPFMLAGPSKEWLWLFLRDAREDIYETYISRVITEVLYIGILVAPPRIYVVRNYIGEAVENLIGILQARPETFLKFHQMI